MGDGPLVGGAAPAWAGHGVAVYHADSLDLLRLVPDESVDAVVTDPPYGLEFMGKEWDTFRVDDPGTRRNRGERAGTHGELLPENRTNAAAGLVTYGGGKRATTSRCTSCGKRDQYRNPHGCGDARWASEIIDPYAAPPTSLAFQEWVRTWAVQAYRVLKPGGHLLAFGGSRTFHRLAAGVEDAGFDVRDSIMWVYAQGFPKSHDVAKAIDQAGGSSPAEQARVLRAARERAGLSREQVAEMVGCTPSSVRDWEEGRARTVGRAIEFVVPSPEYRARMADLLGYSDDERVIVGVGGGRRSLYETGHRGVAYGAATTPAAQAWAGWGTALKPAHEPIVVARKPMAGTVAANVLAYGTGALNIGGCRVPMGETDRTETEAKNRHADFGTGPRQNHVYGTDNRPVGDLGNYDGSAGRWPSNLVLSHAPLYDDEGVIVGDACAAGCVRGCPVAELDAQSGVTASPVPYIRSADARKGATGWNPEPAGSEVPGYGDSGGASRFFPVFRYEPKAPTGERPRVAGTDEDDGRAVMHPTVKPLDLMRWLVRLVAPPGGLVLDPFLGSGTTAEACVVEGFRCVGIERDPDSVRLAAERLGKPIQPTLL